MTPQEARAWLLAHNFIELPVGSYYRWLEEDWFERYKTVLVFKKGAWIPSMNKLQGLSSLDRQYNEYKRLEYIKEKETAQLALHAD